MLGNDPFVINLQYEARLHIVSIVSEDTVRRQADVRAGVDSTCRQESPKPENVYKRHTPGIVRGTCISNRAARPRANSLYSLNLNSCDISGRRVLHGREFHSGANINLGQLLEQFGRTTFLDASFTVKHCILCESHRTLCGCLKGDRDSRVLGRWAATTSSPSNPIQTRVT